MEYFGNIYHNGFIVADIERAMATMGEQLSLDWAPVRRFEPLRVWVPDDGYVEAHLKATYGRRGPIHMELIEIVPGHAYDRLQAVSDTHIGVWVADVGDEVEALLGKGWTLAMAGASPKHRYGQMAYLHKDGGPVVELVGEAIRPMIEEWIASEPTA